MTATLTRICICDICLRTDCPAESLARDFGAGACDQLLLTQPLYTSERYWLRAQLDAYLGWVRYCRAFDLELTATADPLRERNVPEDAAWPHSLWPNDTAPAPLLSGLGAITCTRCGAVGTLHRYGAHLLCDDCEVELFTDRLAAAADSEFLLLDEA